MLTHMYQDGTYGIVYSLDETFEQVRNDSRQPGFPGRSQRPDASLFFAPPPLPGGGGGGRRACRRTA